MYSQRSTEGRTFDFQEGIYFGFKIKTNIPLDKQDALIDGAGKANEDMADKLAEYFHNSPELWMDLQKKFDEYKMKLQKG